MTNLFPAAAQHMDFNTKPTLSRYDNYDDSYEKTNSCAVTSNIGDQKNK